MIEPDCPYGVEDLAERAGVSRRTVRYYVQRGLLPAPLGFGRGKHYSEAHLATLVRIRELQEAGVALTDIAQRLEGKGAAPAPAPAPAASQSAWTRVLLAAGVELHLQGRRLSQEQIYELASVVKKTIGDIGS
jgi:DNA-binding transcriptional MerR regulator